MGALSSAWPASTDQFMDLTSCPAAGDGCLLLEAVRVSTDSGSVAVYAGRSEPTILTSNYFEVILAAMVVLLTMLTALATWYMVGRTLRPMTGIRAELADITLTDLTRRVPEPKGGHEIAQLARTVNETLDRLQYSAEQQRRFSADASHELRTPIAGLRSQAEAALLYPDDTDMVDTLEAMLGDLDRLEAIITDLLLLARLGSGTGGEVRESIDLADLVDQEVHRRPMAPIRTKLAPGLSVTGVRMQLVRLLGNLLDNAERHCVDVIDVELTETDGEAVLSVTGDGAGIAPKDRDRIFDRFTRLDAARSRDAGGTGLGLPIAHNIAVAHGGSLRVEDSPRGARFVARLPLIEDETAILSS
jgi:signal transduction histidine kinase